MYARDKDIVSSIIFPAMLLSWVHEAKKMAGEHNLDSAFNEVDQLLIEAETIGLSGLDSAQSLKIARRVDRLIKELFDRYRGDNMAKSYLAIAHAMVELTSSGKMVIDGDSPLSQAFELLTDAVTTHEDVYHAVDKSATKAGRRIAETLIDQGYF